MTLQHRFLPQIPHGIDVQRLHSNLKLYSDEQLSRIKEQCTTNGRYRECQGEAFPYTIYVFNGKYFAAYPHKVAGKDNTDTAKIKFLQDQDTGVWHTDKIIKVVEEPTVLQVREEDVMREKVMLAKVNLAVRAGNEPVSFFRPLESKEISPNSTTKEIKSTFGARSGMFRRRQKEKNVSTAGKHHLLMRYVPGMNLEQWIHRNPDLPLIIKMEIATDLISAVMELHKQGILHRDIKLQNVIASVMSKLSEPVTVIDFGLAAYANQVERDAYSEYGTPGYKAPEIGMEDARAYRKYSVESDIYALGVTLRFLFRLYPTTFFFQGSDELKTDLTRIFDAMSHDKPEQRVSLQEVHDYFTRLKNQLKPEDRLVNICVLNIVDFMMLEDSSQFALDALYQRLKSFHQIRLYDETGAASYKTLLTIKQKLQEKSVCVSEKVYQGRVDLMQAYVNSHTMHSSRTGRIYNVCLDGYVPKSRLASYVSVNESGDTVIDLSQASTDDLLREGEGLLNHGTEQYDVGGCMAAFMSDLWEDGLKVAESIVNHCRPQSSVDHASGQQFSENDLSDSETELRAYGLRH